MEWCFTKMIKDINLTIGNIFFFLIFWNFILEHSQIWETGGFISHEHLWCDLSKHCYNQTSFHKFDTGTVSSFGEFLVCELSKLVCDQTSGDIGNI